MDTILDSLRKVADVVILDGSPFLVTDAALLSSKVDGVLLVVRSGHSRKNEVLYAIEQLDRVGARVLGVVLNGIQRSTESLYSRYHYYNNEYISEGFGNSKVEKNLAKKRIALPQLVGKKKKKAEIVLPGRTPRRHKVSADTTKSFSESDGK
jgi:Mrp family chromosome partitioning ATPase